MSVDIKKLKRSQIYSEELGIKLKLNNDQELFKWFLASILFGTRISENIAKKTYKTFEKYQLLRPEKIINAGWDFLVDPIMREGGYVRYDGKTSTQILRNCENLIQEYKGSLKALHREARDSRDLEAKLRNFYGVGPITINIFLRELRAIWEKSDPEPSPLVKRIATILDVNLNKFDRKSMTFTRIEAGLIRMRRQFK
jgi:hypothetical protein